MVLFRHAGRRSPCRKKRLASGTLLASDHPHVEDDELDSRYDLTMWSTYPVEKAMSDDKPAGWYTVVHAGMITGMTLDATSLIG